MTRARILADYVNAGDELALKAPLASPTFTGTTTVSGDLVPSTPLSHRNMIINGGMQVAQRNTSATSVTSNGYHACDRMYTQFTNGGTWTIAQSTDAPAGFSNSFRMDCTATANMGSANDFVGVFQKMEAQNLQHLAYGTASAEAMVMSFWVKSNKTGTYAVMFYAPDGDRIVGGTYAISVANTWEYKTMTIPADTGGTINNDNGEGFRALFYLATGTGRTSGTALTSWGAYALASEAVGHNVNMADNTANDWSITGLQIELGSNATPFEHRSYGDELRRCQRYYSEIPTQFGFQAQGDSSSYATIRFTLPEPLRATPAIEQINSIASRIYDHGTDSGFTNNLAYQSNTNWHITISDYKANTCLLNGILNNQSNLAFGRIYEWVAVGSYRLGINAEL